MKIFLIVLVILFSLTFTSQSFAEQPIQVIIDGEKINFTNNPIIENGTTLVEFRPIFEKLGLQIGWDEATQTVTGYKDGLDIQLKIGTNTSTVNGQNKQLLLAPRIINGKTMIPLRFIGEASGKKVDWDAASNSVKIDALTVNKNKKNSYLSLNIVPVVKINNSIFCFELNDNPYIDNDNNYYLSGDLITSLINVYHKDYKTLEPSGNNPYIQGYLRIENKNKYVLAEQKYLNIKDSYFEGFLINNNAKYLFSTKPGEEKGVVLLAGKIIFPATDVFNTLGIKYTVTRDDKNKMLIFSF